MGYMYLSFAIVGELIGDNLLKASAGFTRPVYGISALLSYGICFYFFSLSLKTINLNIAYAVWAGIGILLTAVIAFLFLEGTDQPRQYFRNLLHHCGGRDS